MIVQIDYPSSCFFEKAVEAVENNNDIEITVISEFRGRLLKEYLPYLLENKGQKPKIWKSVFRWIYLGEFLGAYGAIIENRGYDINYSCTEEIKIFAKNQEAKSMN
jgi:hypothetical protein